jgi:hypothetical protein
MITPPEYKVMGEDGHDYGPVSAEQIRKWVVEQRLDRKSPILPPDSKDWVFLESLPEFDDLFRSPPPPPRRSNRKWLLATVIVLITGAAIVALKKFYHH